MLMSARVSECAHMCVYICVTVFVNERQVVSGCICGLNNNNNNNNNNENNENNNKKEWGERINVLKHLGCQRSYCVDQV